MSTIIRRDCAYCIDLQEQGALCDHPCTLYGGEPIDAVCNGCRRYERRMSTCEMLDRIHVLEKRLKESEFWREKYADEIIQLKPENAKLRELCEGMLVCYESCNELLDARTDCLLYDENEPLRCRKARLLRELRIEVKE